MIIWTDNIEPLIDVSMTEYPVTAEITVEAAEPLEPPLPPAQPPFIVSVHAVVDPLLADKIQITTAVTDGIGTVIVHAPDWHGTFPPDGLDYLLDGRLQTAGDWNALPPAAEQIIAFRPHPVPLYEYELTVTATYNNGEDELSDHERTYVIRLSANYTPGRDTLLEEVNARRRA